MIKSKVNDLKVFYSLKLLYLWLTETLEDGNCQDVAE